MYFQMLKYYCFVQSCHTYVCVHLDITCPYIWNQTCIYKPLYCRIWAVQCSYEKSASVSTEGKKGKARELFFFLFFFLGGGVFIYLFCFVFVLFFNAGNKDVMR